MSQVDKQLSSVVLVRKHGKQEGFLHSLIKVDIPLQTSY